MACGRGHKRADKEKDVCCSEEGGYKLLWDADRRPSIVRPYGEVNNAKGNSGVDDGQGICDLRGSELLLERYECKSYEVDDKLICVTRRKNK